MCIRDRNTTLDTAGNPFTLKEPFISQFKELMKVTDLVMLDLKEIDEEKHKELTGYTNQNILEMAKFLSDNGTDMWIRHVLVPGLTDEDVYKRQEQECSLILPIRDLWDWPGLTAARGAFIR